MNDLLNVIADAEDARKRLEKSFRKITRSGKLEEIAVMNRELTNLRWHLIETRRLAAQQH